MFFLRCFTKCGWPDVHDEYKIENVIIDDNSPCVEFRNDENIISGFPEIENKDPPTGKEAQATGSKTDKAWFTNMVRRTSTIIISTLTNEQSASERWRSLIRKKVLKKPFQLSDQRNEFFVGDFISALQIMPYTFLVKATLDNTKECLASYYIQLEIVPFCKECDRTFDNTEQLLSTLMTTKTEKVPSAGNDKQKEYYQCKICSAMISYEKSQKNHLLKHIESQEVICEECEEWASESSSKYSKEKVALPDRNLKKVRLLRIIATCRLCNKITLVKRTSLPEVFTVDQHDLCDSQNKRKYTCSECSCDLSSSFKDVKGNIIVPRKPLCKKCSGNDRLETPFVGRTLKTSSRTASTAKCPTSEKFGMRRPPSRRHIFIGDMNKSIDINVSDFIIKDARSDIDTWFICRICGYSSKIEKEINTHVLRHISFKAICSGCEVDDS